MNTEMLLYILHHFSFELDILVEQVLNDSEEDPQFSAVTATNLIKCYIQIMLDLNKKMPYRDVKGYFENAGFSENDYLLFEKKRIEESTYYIGKQF